MFINTHLTTFFCLLILIDNNSNDIWLCNVSLVHNIVSFAGVFTTKALLKPAKSFYDKNSNLVSLLTTTVLLKPTMCFTAQTGILYPTQVL